MKKLAIFLWITASFFVVEKVKAADFNFDNSALSVFGSVPVYVNQTGYSSGWDPGDFAHFIFSAQNLFNSESLTLYLGSYNWDGFNTTTGTPQEVSVTINFNDNYTCSAPDYQCSTNWTATSTISAVVPGTTSPVVFDHWISDFGTVQTAIFGYTGASSSFDFRVTSSTTPNTVFVVDLVANTSTPFSQNNTYQGGYRFPAGGGFTEGRYVDPVFIPKMIINGSAEGATGGLIVNLPSSTLATLPGFECPDWGFLTPLCSWAVWLFVPDISSLTTQFNSTVNVASAKFPFSYVASLHTALTDNSSPTSTQSLTVTLPFNYTTTTSFGTFAPTSWTAFSTTTVMEHVPVGVASTFRFLITIALYFAAIELVYFGAIKMLNPTV